MKKSPILLFLSCTSFVLFVMLLKPVQAQTESGYGQVSSLSEAIEMVDAFENTIPPAQLFAHTYTISGDVIASMLSASSVSFVWVKNGLLNPDATSAENKIVMLVPTDLRQKLLPTAPIYTVPTFSMEFQKFGEERMTALSLKNKITNTEKKQWEGNYQSMSSSKAFDEIRGLRMKRAALIKLLAIQGNTSKYDLRVHHGVKRMLGGELSRVVLLTALNKDTGQNSEGDAFLLLDDLCLCPNNCDVN